MPVNDPKIQMNTNQAFELASQHHQARRLAEAEKIYRQILAHQPDHADALHQLGLLAAQTGKFQIARELIARAITINPGSVAYYGNLANTLTTLGRYDEAVKAYHTVLKFQPDSAQTYHNLGLCLKMAGNSGQAIAAFREAIRYKADFPQAYLNLSDCLRTAGQLDLAMAACQKAVHFKPDLVEAYVQIGMILQSQGQLDAAEASYRTALKINPNDVSAHNNLGIALAAMGKNQEALSEYQQALNLKPAMVETYNNLGIALKKQGRLDQAIQAFTAAIKFEPGLAAAHSNLANCLKDQGQINQAIAAYRGALQRGPQLHHVHSNLLLTMHYHSTVDAAAIYKETIEWNRLYAEPLKKFIQPHANNVDPERKLRIGYISSDFRTHSVAFFMENLLASHNTDQFEIFCYADLSSPDQTTARLGRLARHWRNIKGINDQQVAELIHKDQVDILVDLTGHTAGDHLLVFACKPAPVQVAYLGYPNTTGLNTIDYRFTDVHADPAGQTENFYSEELVRLKNTFLCYRPPDNAPPVGPAPAIKNGFITFGCFNILPKMNDKLVELWVQILQQTPRSRMLVKNLSMSDPGARRHLLDMFAAFGIDQDRLVLRENIPSPVDHLELYNSVDLALDTFPYNGTTTTCEALWMGVPVATLAGKTHMSRVGVSLLSNVGLPELIGQTPEQYVQIAVQLAGDLPKLGELRKTLRQRMENSPLLDAKCFAANVEAAYRNMWRKWCTDAANRVENR